MEWEKIDWKEGVLVTAKLEAEYSCWIGRKDTPLAVQTA